MKTNNILVALLALIVGLALGWLIAGQNAQAPVAMAPGQGSTVVNNIYDYVPAASVNANVYDTQTGGVIGQEQGEAGTCKYNNSGKLLCPGFANGNVTQCLDWMKADMAEANITDPDMLLALIDSCVNGFDGIQLGQLTAAEIQGIKSFEGPRCEAIKTRINKIIDNCQEKPGTICTVDGKRTRHSMYQLGSTQLFIYNFWTRDILNDRYWTQFQVYNESGNSEVVIEKGATYVSEECSIRNPN